ncbi:MAG TPA: twin-arginine translocation pathway signal protein [Bacteroidetes bacterium]|nr:twin-arginine translocation pathway signal protein [Bacteroidota bacterium]
MERRKLIKGLGILGIAGIGTSMLSSCNDKKEQKEQPEQQIVQKQKTDMNRQEMKIKDTQNPTEFELKHTPEISLGDKDAKGFTKVEITVGSKNIIHPTSKDHWIDYLKLYKDGELVGNLVIEPGMARGFSGFRVNLDGAKILKAEIGCNLHGIWQSTMTL